MEANFLLQELKPKKILVMRALNLGDMLCSTPAFRSLRRACPDAQITLVGLPWARALMQRCENAFDHFIEFPGYPGLPEQESRLNEYPAFLQTLQQKKFDLALQMHGSGEITNTLLSGYGARHCAGYARPNHYHPPNGFFLEHDSHQHEVIRWLNLLEGLGAANHGFHLEFQLYSQDEEELHSHPTLADMHAKPYACVHPGARNRGKCWPTTRFAAVADSLAERGLQIVLTGSEKETDLTTEVARQMKYPAVDSAPLDLPLGPLATLLRKAKLVVCNDTGISHLTAAVGTPSVVLFSATDPQLWAPLNKRIHCSLDSRVHADISPEKIVAHAMEVCHA